MDYGLLVCYIFAFILLGNRWGGIAVVAFAVSAIFAEHELSFIISSLCHMPLCLHPQKKVSLAALNMVIIFGLFAWEDYFSASYFLNDASYITLMTVLNLALIISLLKSQKNGITVPALHELYDNKPNKICSTENKRGQRP